jgi:hypothetical protein
VQETSVWLERERSRERAHGALLDRLLGPLAEYLGDPLTQNVNVNADHAIVVEHGERGKFYASPRSTASVWIAEKQGSVPRSHPSVEPPQWG